MKQFSILGQTALRFAAKLLPTATLALLLASPVAAQTGGLEPTAPENLPCPGRARPQAGCHFEAQGQNVAAYSGRVQELALDHSCNLFVVDMVGNQVVKYNADGQQVAALKMLAREPFTDDVAGIALAPDGTP